MAPSSLYFLIGPCADVFSIKRGQCVVFCGVYSRICNIIFIILFSLVYNHVKPSVGVIMLIDITYRAGIQLVAIYQIKM